MARGPKVAMQLDACKGGPRMECCWQGCGLILLSLVFHLISSVRVTTTVTKPWAFWSKNDPIAYENLEDNLMGL